jgi:DNA polymerase II small subunit/DNA polymerase delta subunit B
MAKQKPELAVRLEHEIHELMEEIKEQRGELELKIYLAKAEARDEWEKAEKKWQEFKGKADVLGKEVKNASSDVGAAAKALAQELKRAYIRIHRQIKQS